MKMFLSGNIMPLFANFSRGIVPYPPICPPLNPGRERGECPHPQPLSQGGRGEIALTPNPSPKAGEGRLRAGDEG